MNAFAHTGETIVTTTSGKLRGSYDTARGLHRFLGIPYAQPPVGPLRFKPPVPVQPWAEVRDAKRFGHASMQVFDGLEGEAAEFDETLNGATPAFVGQEDCLTLNIWTPSPEPAQRRPLLIWIHGGANHLESSRLSAYDGSNLTQAGDIVFASLNYRLGLFGFFDISVLGGDDYAGSICNGLRDQMLAIDWIIANAECFGADPDNVTIAGESAGGMNISWLLASGRLTGRIRRAIIMSNVKGPAGFGETPESSRHDPQVGRTIARQLLQKLDYNDIETILAAPASEIFTRLTSAGDMSETAFGLDRIFYPCTDPSFVPEEPFRALRAGVADGIDLIIGHTTYEAGLWLNSDPDMDKRPPEWMATRFGNLPPEVQRAAPEKYRAWMPDEAEGCLGMHIMSDCGFVMPTIWFAEEALARGARCWVYRFEWQVDERFRAMHAADLPFFFGDPNGEAGSYLIGPPRNDAEASTREALCQTMQGMMLAFIRHGDPNLTGQAHLPSWPGYDLIRRPMMSFDSISQLVFDPDAERRRWWTDVVYQPVMGSGT